MGILSVIGLCALIFMLLYISFRILISIVSTFVYLTGLTVVLIFVVFTLSIVLCFVKRLFRRYKCYKRSKLSSNEIINLICKFQLRIVYELSTFTLSLYIVKLIVSII